MIAFDNDSLRSLGYPIHRSVYPQILELLKTPPRALAFDFIFGESDDVDGTAKLKSSLDRFPGAILAGITTEEGEIDGPSQVLLSQNRNVGLTVSYADDDGILRWYPLLVATREGDVPSLGFALYLRSLTPDASLPPPVAAARRSPDGITEAVEIRFSNGRKIEIDTSADTSGLGRLPLVPRAESSAIHNISWSEILGEAKTPIHSEFAYLMASTADGLRSIQSTPLDAVQSAAHNHLFAFEDLVGSRWLRALPANSVLFSIVGLGLAGVLIFAPPVSYSLTVSLFVCLSALTWAMQLLFWRSGYLWSPAGESVALAGWGLSSLANRWMTEDKKRESLIKSFSTYLHPSIVDKLAASDDMVKLGGEARELTILFADLRNFTSLSEKVSAETLVEIMNEYFTLATRHVQDSQGTVDKFIGDAVMAFWNAPLDQSNHRELARNAVVRMKKDFDALSLSWSERFSLKEPVRIGVGLHSGRAVVGNVGGAGRFNYTALGDEVNTASRLEGICKVYGIGILASESVVESAPEWLEVDCIQLKGQTKSVRLFTPIVNPDWSAPWKAMRSAYTQGDFASARALLESVPLEFGPRAAFESRLRDLRSAPEGWTGVFKFNEK